MWLRHPWRRLRYSDTVQTTAPVTALDSAEDPVLWTVSPPLHPRLDWCEFGNLKLTSAALSVTRALMRQVMLLPSALAPRRLQGLSALPIRAPRDSSKAVRAPREKKSKAAINAADPEVVVRDKALSLEVTAV